MTANLPQSICRSANGGEIGERREKRSISAPAKIWLLMLLETGGGFKARAFVGIGRGVAVDKEKE